MRGFFSGAIYAAAVAGILAIFAVVGWVSDFLSVGTWLYPRLEPYFSPRSTIHVDLAADMPVKVSLFVEDPVNPGTSLTTSDVQQRQPAVLNRTHWTHLSYRMDGSGFRGGHAQDPICKGRLVVSPSERWLCGVTRVKAKFGPRGSSSSDIARPRTKCGVTLLGQSEGGGREFQALRPHNRFTRARSRCFNHRIV
jgi:hypothetical protein